MHPVLYLSAVNESTDQPTAGNLTRVCRACSTQSTGQGAFCPNCGKSYIRGSRKPSRKVVVVALVATLLVGGSAAGVAAKISHDRRQEANAVAEAKRKAAEEAEAEAERAEAAAAAEAERKRKARLEKERAERKYRQQLIAKLQKSVTQDARENVAEGILDGPILFSQCDPLGGGSVDDLTALTTTFDCLAVNERLSGNRVSGWSYSATINWDESSWSWRLG